VVQTRRITPFGRFLCDGAMEKEKVMKTGTFVQPFARTWQQQDGEYRLLGLGVRKVSFLRVQVYVVGLYVHAEDIAPLCAPHDSLAERMAQEHTRAILRIVPVRNTDFGHLRDGFVRGIRKAHAATDEGAEEEGMEEGIDRFKGLFFRGAVPKDTPLLLRFNREGLSVDCDDKELGSVKDPRIARAILTSYVNGGEVVSPSARDSILAGLRAMCRCRLD